MEGPLGEFALLLICALAGALFVRLRKPVPIAYIVVGIMAGPSALELVGAHDQIDLLAQVGVAVLLFAVSLKLDLHHVRHLGPVALATGLGQLAFTIALGFLLILALGKGAREALYAAAALTFPSTIIIVKLLSDKREHDSLHGLTTLVGLVTITASTYVILYSRPLYGRLAPWLGVLERRRPSRELAVERQPRPDPPIDVIVFGLGRYGGRLLARLRDAGVEAIGVDRVLNPFDDTTDRAAQTLAVQAHPQEAPA